MRIVSNPGSNVPPHLIDRYEIEMAPQHIVVDGTEHDTRGGIDLAQVDRWIASAKEHPYVLGTSAAEFTRCFSELGREEDSLLVVMSSRRIIPSFDAAVSAARTLKKRSAYAKLLVRVVDTMSTDAGAGLPTIFAGEARAAGVDAERIGDMLDRSAKRARFAVIPRTLDNLIKGGRAGFLRGWLAKMLRVRPILSLVDGELQAVGRCSAEANLPEVLANWLKDNIRAQDVWVGVAHGGNVEEAEALAALLRKRFNVRYETVLPITPSIYLHSGPGALGVVVHPVDGLPWTPPRPPAG